MEVAQMMHFSQIDVMFLLIGTELLGIIKKMAEFQNARRLSNCSHGPSAGVVGVNIDRLDFTSGLSVVGVFCK